MAFDPAKLEAVKESAAGATGYDPARLEKLKKKSPSEALYSPSGQAVVTETPQTGMPSAGDFDFKTSAKQTGSYIYDNFIQGQIIPIAASIAATRLPAVATGTTARNIVAPLVEGAYQGTAGYLADKANQALDISPPGEDQAIAQGGIQGAAAMGQKAFRILKPWHGREGAVRANEIAETEARDMIEKYRPTQPSGPMFQEASKDKVTVPMKDTTKFVRQTINDLTHHDPTVHAGNLESKLNQNYGAAGKHLYRLMEATRGNQPLPSDTWQWFHTRLGAESKALKKPGVSSIGDAEVDQLYNHMMTDLERRSATELAPAIQGPHLSPPITPQAKQGATKLLQALDTYRREMSVDRLSGYVEKAMGVARGQGGDAQFNAASVMRELKQDRFFSKAFTPAEQRDIQQTFQILNNAPALPPPASQVTGSRHVVERGIGATAGASVGGAVGAVAGWTLKDVGNLSANLSFAMSTKTGRALIRELSQSPGGMTNGRNLSVITSYVTAMKNQPTDEGSE